MKLLGLSAVLFLGLWAPAVVAALAQRQLQQDDQHNAVEAVIRRLSLFQKLNFVRGQLLPDGYVGRTGGERVRVPVTVEAEGEEGPKKKNVEVHIPPLKMNDGPQGFRMGNPVDMLLNSGSSTQWPSSLCVAASFDTAVVEKYASALTAEFAGKGANVLLGPGVTLAREPRNGRTWEYLSGEEPILGALLGRAYLDGVSNFTKAAQAGAEKGNMLAVLKHFVNNNQEAHRTSVDARVGEAAEMDFYFKPYAWNAFHGSVGSLMCSYNLINATYACENELLLKRLRKVADAVQTAYDPEQQGGASGDFFYVSDWLATHSVGKGFNASLDMEMPFGRHRNTLRLLYDMFVDKKSGEFGMTQLDGAVRNILRAMAKTKLLDLSAVVSAIGEDVEDVSASEVAVIERLLREELGHAVSADSMSLAHFESIMVRHGKLNAVQLDAERTAISASGEVASYADKEDDVESKAAAVSEPYPPIPGTDPALRANVTGPAHKTLARELAGESMIVLRNEAGLLPLDETKMLPSASEVSPSYPLLTHNCDHTKYGGRGSGQVGPSHSFSVNEALSARGLKDATQANQLVLLACLSSTSIEGFDRKDLDLDDATFSPVAQKKALSKKYKIAESKVKVVVLASSPGHFLSDSFRGSAEAILLSFLPGEQAGFAFLDAVFGAVNPSGKLPISLPMTDNDFNFTTRQYPGEYDSTTKTYVAHYDEGELIGHRYYQQKKSLVPAWPFGFGLTLAPEVRLDISSVIYSKVMGKQHVGFCLQDDSVGLGNSGSLIRERAMARRAKFRNGAAQAVQLYAKKEGKSFLELISVQKLSNLNFEGAGANNCGRFELDSGAIRFALARWDAAAGKYVDQDPAELYVTIMGPLIADSLVKVDMTPQGTPEENIILA